MSSRRICSPPPAVLVCLHLPEKRVALSFSSAPCPSRAAFCSYYPRTCCSFCCPSTCSLSCSCTLLLVPAPSATLLLLLPFSSYLLVLLSVHGGDAGLLPHLLQVVLGAHGESERHQVQHGLVLVSKVWRTPCNCPLCCTSVMHQCGGKNAR